MKNGLHTLLVVKKWGLTAAAIIIAVIVAGAFTAGPAIAQAVRAALVSNVDDPGRIPYQATGEWVLDGTAGDTRPFPSVLAGKRLVITNVTGLLRTSNSGGPFVLVGVSRNNAIAPDLFFPVTFAGLSSGQNLFVFNQPTLMVVEAADRPEVNVSLGAVAVRLTARVTLTGYMLDCTTGPCAPIAH